MINVCLMGRAGSGKSTLAKRIAKDFYLEVIDSSILKRHVRKKRKDFQIIEKCIADGIAVPNDIFFACIKEKIAETKNKEGFVFDGLPYTTNQISEIEKLLKIDFYFYIKVNKRIADERLNLHARDNFSPDFVIKRDKIFEEKIKGMKKILKRRVIELNGKNPPDWVYLKAVQHINMIAE